MSESKMSVKIGAIEFTGEGDKDWLESQLKFILAHAKDLVKLTPYFDQKM